MFYMFTWCVFLCFALLISLLEFYFVICFDFDIHFDLEFHSAIRNSLYSELEQRLNDSETLKTISALQIELSDCKMAKVLIILKVLKYSQMLSSVFIR